MQKKRPAQPLNPEGVQTWWQHKKRTRSKDNVFDRDADRLLCLHNGPGERTGGSGRGGGGKKKGRHNEVPIGGRYSVKRSYGGSVKNWVTQEGEK